MRRVLLAFLLLLPFQAARGESLWQTLPATPAPVSGEHLGHAKVNGISLSTYGWTKSNRDNGWLIVWVTACRMLTAKSRYSQRAKKRSALPMPTFETAIRTLRRSTMAFRGHAIAIGRPTPFRVANRARFAVT
jgi:hypothetical protein